MHSYFGIKPSQELGMGSVFEKLNLKDHGEIVVVNAPASFGPSWPRLTVLPCCAIFRR
ncbi:hypothetical protein [Rhodanobacter sp. ANJX3]|uniref:hypothetical protein n=1 Tax=Rhodanobacter sp. ANJX3 TaxID=2723083 RepID=UPI00161D4D80|nr:hypothetical protein [Rhodanobacter sp. ANJX3]